MGFVGGLLIGTLVGMILLIVLVIGLPRLFFGKPPSADQVIREQFGPPDPRSDPAAKVELRPEDVPEELREVVPLACKWGIGCDGIRGELVQAATPEERAELVTMMRRHWWTIQKWLDYTRAGTPEWLVPLMYARVASEEMEDYVMPPKPNTR